MKKVSLILVLSIFLGSIESQARFALFSAEDQSRAIYMKPNEAGDRILFLSCMISSEGITQEPTDCRPVVNNKGTEADSNGYSAEDLHYSRIYLQGKVKDGVAYVAGVAVRNLLFPLVGVVLVAVVGSSWKIIWKGMKASGRAVGRFVGKVFSRDGSIEGVQMATKVSQHDTSAIKRFIKWFKDHKAFTGFSSITVLGLPLLQAYSDGVVGVQAPLNLYSLEDLFNFAADRAPEVHLIQGGGSIPELENLLYIILEQGRRQTLKESESASSPPPASPAS